MSSLADQCRMSCGMYAIEVLEAAAGGSFEQLGKYCPRSIRVAGDLLRVEKTLSRLRARGYLDKHDGPTPLGLKALEVAKEAQK